MRLDESEAPVHDKPGAAPLFGQVMVKNVDSLRSMQTRKCRLTRYGSYDDVRPLCLSDCADALGDFGQCFAGLDRAVQARLVPSHRIELPCDAPSSAPSCISACLHACAR